MRGVYNGMPAAGLPDAHWQASRHGQAPAGGQEVAAQAGTVLIETAQAELALLSDGSIAMRNSRHPGGPALIYTHAEIAAFIGGAKDGDFDDLLELAGCGVGG